VIYCKVIHTPFDAEAAALFLFLLRDFIIIQANAPQAQGKRSRRVILVYQPAQTALQPHGTRLGRGDFQQMRIGDGFKRNGIVGLRTGEALTAAEPLAPKARASS
jgi:hypothetical protein